MSLRTAPDPARLSCWCRGWGHFYNTAKYPPELTYCGNCEDADKDDRWARLSELEKDLMLARQGDYPGATGCKRIAAAYDALAIAMEARQGGNEVPSASADDSAGRKASPTPTQEP